MNRIDAEGQRVRDEWTCTASVLAEPMRVVDLYTPRDGKIARLETTLLHASVGVMCISFRLQARQARGMIGMG